MTEREQFENVFGQLPHTFSFFRAKGSADPDAPYHFHTEQTAWEAWQARASLAGTVAPPSKEENCPLGCNEACFAKQHGCASECPALPWQPPSQEYAEWILVGMYLPTPGLPVLLDIGGKFPIRAMWVAKHTVPAGDNDTDWAEYVEADDAYYSPEGWYEWNHHEETHWAVSETPIAWMALPTSHTLRDGGTP